MNRQLVIGFSSVKLGGKDMAATLMEEQFKAAGIRTKTLRMADPLKDLVATLFGWDRERLDSDQEYKERVDPFWGISPRVALQKVGTELFRDGALKTQFNINMWVDKFRFEAQRILREYKQWGDSLVLMCPDVRFHDEFEAIRELGGTLIFMDPRPRIRQDPTPHASEQDMWFFKDWDYVLDYGHGMQLSIDETIDLAKKLLYDHFRL